MRCVRLRWLERCRGALTCGRGTAVAGIAYGSGSGDAALQHLSRPGRVSPRDVRAAAAAASGHDGHMAVAMVLHDRVNRYRLVLHRPVDVYDDGYFHGLEVELLADGLTVAGYSTVEGRGGESLPGFLRRLAQGWRGWDGAWVWSSYDEEMALSATHDGRRHVSIAVTLARPFRPFEADAWSVTVPFTFEAGEELTQAAREADATLVPLPG